MIIHYQIRFVKCNSLTKDVFAFIMYMYICICSKKLIKDYEMIKIFPSRPEGRLTPPSSDKSLLSLLVLACLSDAPCKIRYKGLSDSVSCAIFALEKAGAVIRIDSEYLNVTPPKGFPGSLHISFRDSKSALTYLLPTLKAFITELELDSSEKLSLENMSSLFGELEKGGCKSNGVFLPASITGKLERGIILDTSDTDISDAFLLSLAATDNALGGLGFSADTLNALNEFGLSADSENGITRLSGTVHAPCEAQALGDTFYTAFFSCACDSLESSVELPRKMRPLFITKKENSNYIHIPKLREFSINVKPSDEEFLPCLLLALRTRGKCVFENYRANATFHNRLIQFLRDLEVEYSVKNGLLSITSEGLVKGKKIRGCKDGRFVVLSCLAACHSKDGVEIDSISPVLEMYPTFFSDAVELGMKETKL